MKKLISSFGFVFNGRIYAAKTQLNFRMHLTVAMLAVVLGCVLHITKSQWLWILLSISLVLIRALLNTAIKLLTELVSPGYHKLAWRVNEISAGAVTIAAAFAFITGLLFFYLNLWL